MKKPLVLGIFTAVLVASALLIFTAGKGADKSTAPRQTAADITQAAASQPDPATKQAASAAYADYTSLDAASADRPLRVLFFKADWCYTCTGLHKDIESNGTAVPADVQIIRVDYDKETSLKQKYDVRQQHTLVQIDADGNVIKKWVLSPTLKDVVAKIERT